MADQTVSNRVLTVPNAISAARLLLVPVFAVLVFRGHDLLAVGVLAVSGFSDWLDGKLARRLGQVSRLGQVLDPAADRLFVLVALLGLAWRGAVPWWLVALLLAREAVVGVQLVVMRRNGLGPHPVVYVGKAGTFVLMYAFPLLLLSTVGGVVGQTALVVGWAFVLWGVLFYWSAGLYYLRRGAALLRQVRLAGGPAA